MFMAPLFGCCVGNAPHHCCLHFRRNPRLVPLVFDCPVTWVNHKSPNMTCSLWTWPYPDNTFLWQYNVCDMMTGYDYDLYSHKFRKKEHQHILFDEMTCGTAKGAHSSCTKIIQNTVLDVHGSACSGCCVENAPHHYCLHLFECPVNGSTTSLQTWRVLCELGPIQTIRFSHNIYICDMMTGYDYDLYSHKMRKRKISISCLMKWHAGQLKALPLTLLAPK